MYNIYTLYKYIGVSYIAAKGVHYTENAGSISLRHSLYILYDSICASVRMRSVFISSLRLLDQLQGLP